MIELADIIAPIAPPTAPPPYEWIALGVALFALILFFMLRLWLKRTRARRWARAALKRTERELKLGKLDARAAAFQIAWALRDEYPNKRPLRSQRGEVLRKYLCLRGGRRMDALNSEAWSDFLQTLDRARFSPHPIDTQQAAQLLAQAHQWIGRAP